MSGTESRTMSTMFTDSQYDLSDSQIQSQIEVLNHDYKSANFAFKLVNTTRTFNETVFLELYPGTPMDREIKASLRVGGSQQLNVYSVGYVQSRNLGLREK